MCFAGFLDFFLCFLFLGGEEETDESEVEIDSSEEDEELTLLAFFSFPFFFFSLSYFHAGQKSLHRKSQGYQSHFGVVWKKLPASLPLLTMLIRNRDNTILI